MISATTRAALVTRLRADGTLATEKPQQTISRPEAAQPLIKRIARIMNDNKADVAGRWLAPGHLLQVLP